MKRVLILTLSLVAASTCLIPSMTQAATSATPVASPIADLTQVSVYFLREGRRSEQVGAAHRDVSAITDSEAARAAIEALIDGPNAIDQLSGLTSAIPDGTTLLAVDLDPATKTASVNFSEAFAPGGAGVPITVMAQVVYTVTQFDGIEQASIAVAGSPITMLDGDGIALDGPATRANYDRTTPLIFLESPAPGDTIGNTVRLWGTANTFEGTFQAEIRSADGTVLVSQVVTATSGNGVRGTFDVTLSFNPGEATNGTVAVFERSERSGRADTNVEIPVSFETR